MIRRRQEFLPQNESPGCVGFARAVGWCVGGPYLSALIGSVLTGLVGSTPAAGAVALSLLAPLLLLPWAYRGARRSGVTIDAEGMTEWYDYGLHRRTRWIDVVSVEIEAARAAVTTPRRRVIVAPPLADWLRLAHEARERGQRAAVAADPAKPADTLPPETVAAWLKVPLDAELDSRTDYYPVLYTALFLLVVGLWLVLGPWTLVALAGLPRGRRRVYRIRAYPGGIDVYSAAGRHTYAWSGVTRVVPRGMVWQVTTTDGDFVIPLHMPEVDTLVHALRQAIDAREAGWSLPSRPLDVPDTALSRSAAQTSGGTVERGLSQVSAEPDEMGVVVDAT